jgi:glycerol-3-phosphate dehydrogenase
MAKELDWDEEQTVREIEYYRTRVQAERDSQTKLDDTTADAARLGAPDIVSLRP